MSHAVRRQLVAAAVAASSVALVAAPTAGAATKKLSKAERAQNTAIKKAAKSASSAGKAAKKAGSDAKKAATDAKKGIADAKTATGKADAAQGGVNTVLAGVPAILDGLKKLSDGLTAAGAGLTKLGNAVAAAEYGTVKFQIGTTDVPGAVFNSNDIPDDGNAAILSGTAVIPVPTGLTDAPIRVLAGVRSGEADGTGADNPVASAGIVSLTVTAQTPGVTVGGGNPGIATLPLATKQPAADKPPVYPIPLKAPRSDAAPNPFSFPTDKAIDLTDPATLQTFTAAPGPYTVTTAAPGVVTATFTVRFNDLTASADDVTA